MHSDVQKQYLLLQDRPIIYYALKTFQDSFIDEIVLVVGQGEIEYCRKEIVDKYHFSKVKKIAEGGRVGRMPYFKYSFGRKNLPHKFLPQCEIRHRVQVITMPHAF